MMKFEKNGMMCARCSYGEVLDLIWPIHFEHPSADVEIHVVGSGEPYHEE